MRGKVATIWPFKYRRAYLCKQRRRLSQYRKIEMENFLAGENVKMRGVSLLVIIPGIHGGRICTYVCVVSVHGKIADVLFPKKREGSGEDLIAVSRPVFP